METPNVEGYLVAKHCPKCGFVMAEGCLGYDHVAGWHQTSEVPKSVRKDERKFRHAELNPQSSVTLYAYMCQNCGYIELFKYGATAKIV
jgi:ribosomal protein S27AE